MEMLLPTAIAAAALVGVHLFNHLVRRLDHLPRSRWLSLAGGASVAYVFLHLLPEIAEHQEVAADELAFLKHELVWGLALTGLVAFYALETQIRRGEESGDGGKPFGSTGVETSAPTKEEVRGYHLHMASFAAYNAITGYLLVRREDDDLSRLAFFTLAMGLHFIVTDTGLRRSAPHRWVAHGRWIVAGGIAFGWALGLFIALPELMVSCLIALLGGGIVLNVLKEELPEDRENRLLPFIVGAFGYATLLIASH